MSIKMNEFYCQFYLKSLLAYLFLPGSSNQRTVKLTPFTYLSIIYRKEKLHVSKSSNNN